MGKKAGKKDKSVEQSPETAKSNEPGQLDDSDTKNAEEPQSEANGQQEEGEEGGEEEQEEEVKEPPKKRQKTSDKTDKDKTAQAKDKKSKPKKLVVDDDDDDANEDTQAPQQVAQACTIGQLKKIEDKKPFTDQEAEQVIAEWMEKQNRPYSVQNLLDNFQHQLKRPQCIRLMDLLVESQILSCKEYGKAKVYLINQDCFPETNPEQLKLLDEQIQVRKEEFSELEDALKKKKDNFKEASTGLSNIAIVQDLASIRAEIEALKSQIEPFKESGAKMLTQQDLEQAEGDLKKLQMEWKKRKRGCIDIINQISESMEMNKKDFMKKVGLDTDEENKVVCPL